MHSALGEPGRLAIVDALVLGDTSPSQLRDSLGMASNLLAHHVRVLERAGLVRRMRSEGDRRRSYLTLVPGALDPLDPAAGTGFAAPRIVFVCTENSARSQLAAALWAAASEVPGTSAGTHPAPRIHPGAVAAAHRHGLGLTARTPRSFDEVRRVGDIVITVCDRAHEELATEVRHNHWSVPDPAGDPAADEAFDRALTDLTDRIARLTPVVHLPTTHEPGTRTGTSRAESA